MKQEIVTDLWIEETFRQIMLPQEAAEARRLLQRMHRLIAAALRALDVIEGNGG